MPEKSFESYPRPWRGTDAQVVALRDGVQAFARQIIETLGVPAWDLSEIFEEVAEDLNPSFRLAHSFEDEPPHPEDQPENGGQR